MTTAVVFAYGEVGVRCLKVLVDHGVQILLVVSHEDDPSELCWHGSVAALAAALGLPVATPADPNHDGFVQQIARLRPDFLFCFYYRHMLCDELLLAPSRGALNMHGSLLPSYRGRAPVNWAIVHGEAETGASLHFMTAKPDAGPLVDQQAVPIGINDTALEVSVRVAWAAAQLLNRCLPALIAGTARTVVMDLARGSYFGRRRPEDGQVCWDWPALQIHNLIRAVAPPFPGAFGLVDAMRLRLLGTRYFREAARHMELAPCLYTDGTMLHLDCSDAERLSLTRVDLNGMPLTPAALVRRFGKTPLSLTAPHAREAS